MRKRLSSRVISAIHSGMPHGEALKKFKISSATYYRHKKEGEMSLKLALAEPIPKMPQTAQSLEQTELRNLRAENAKLKAAFGEVLVKSFLLS